MNPPQQIRDHLNFLYGEPEAALVWRKLAARLNEFTAQHPELRVPHDRVTEADAVLITYGDQVQEPNVHTLRSLAYFMEKYLKGIINSVHILPCFPYSSDDGFAVIDYTKINPLMGDWDDIERLRWNFRLMFDAVINHISAQSEWAKGFRRGDDKYQDYFIVVDPATDLSGVTRPRALPLLTPVNTVAGTKHLWTTFSTDQYDLNYQNSAVLLEIIDVLLFYIAHGAEFIRLDAIAYLWKEIGTSCIHLPQTHRVVQIFRSILNLVAPHVIIITETNVPHAENVSYFGDGHNEAQMVYQFSLGPLVLHTFYTEDAAVLRNWAAGLETSSAETTFFNFIASHDGIGVRPAEDILNRAEIQALADRTIAHGGLVSNKTNPDGSESPYELNITLFDALSNPNSDESESVKIARFIASQAIMLALLGVPGIYVHSLVGSSNYHEGVAKTGRARSINREKWQRAEIAAALDNPDTRAARIFYRYAKLLKARAAHSAFHPNGEQRVIGDNRAVFALLRISPDDKGRVLCVHNISAQQQEFVTNVTNLAMKTNLRDILYGDRITTNGATLRLILEPYEIKWLAG